MRTFETDLRQYCVRILLTHNFKRIIMIKSGFMHEDIMGSHKSETIKSEGTGNHFSEWLLFYLPGNQNGGEECCILEKYNHI